MSKESIIQKILIGRDIYQVKKQSNKQVEDFYFDDDLQEDKVEVMVKGKILIFKSEKFEKIKKKKNKNNEEEI